jgi:hypothetical protein
LPGALLMGRPMRGADGGPVCAAPPLMGRVGWLDNFDRKQVERLMRFVKARIQAAKARRP